MRKDKTKSRKATIEAKCRECIYDPTLDNTWREQAENCTSPGCALYDFRPVTIKTAKQRPKKAQNEVVGQYGEAGG